MKAKDASKQEYGLVGRCFHIFGEDGVVQYQGDQPQSISRDIAVAG